jgi:NAD(P)-dependent dehydrogenase (short-subunit alcohol dehydrogenase family)
MALMESQLAQRGANVVVVSRNPEKCAATVEQIKEQTGNQTVDYLVADLSSQDQIRHLVSQFHQKYDRLDVLLNNAGEMFLSRRQSQDGIEMTWALNHLNYFMLTNLLLETLVASGEPGNASRIVNVASAAHRGARIEFNDLQGESRYSGMRAYGQSKLANVLFTYELDRRLRRAGIHDRVSVNALHPGFVSTNLMGDNSWLVRLGARLIYLFAGKSPEEGAETSVYLASSPDVEDVSGKYFVDGQPVRTDSLSYDESIAERLWELSVEMTGVNAEISP